MSLSDEALERLVRGYAENDVRVAGLRARLSRASGDMEWLAAQLRDRPESLLVGSGGLALEGTGSGGRTIPFSDLDLDVICGMLAELQDALGQRDCMRSEFSGCGLGHLPPALESGRSE